MRQTTKFLRILMCMVLGLSMSFQSCKDYDDDIDKLNNRIDGVITDLTTLKETVKGLIKEVTYDAATEPHAGWRKMVNNQEINWKSLYQTLRQDSMRPN